MKSEYSKSRNDVRLGHNLNILAKREISTLCYLINIDDRKFTLMNKTVIDLGCGDRYLQPEIERLGSKYYGFDEDECDLITDRVNMANNSADVILSYSVIEHLIDPSNFYQESYRLLKKGGYLMIMTPNWNFSQNNFYDDYTHVKPYTPKSLSAITKDFGFNVISTVPNLRCKPKFFYYNKYSFRIAKMLPLRGYGGVFGFLKGRATGIYLLAKKD